MTWNYRLVCNKRTDGSAWYGIHEVFYDDRGRAFAETAEPVGALGATPGEVRRAYERMAEAFLQPTLDADSIPEKGAETP